MQVFQYLHRVASRSERNVHNRAISTWCTGLGSAVKPCSQSKSYILLAFMIMFLFQGGGYGQKMFSEEVLRSPASHTEMLEQAFIAKEVSHFLPDTANHLILENGYASAYLLQPDRIHSPENALVDSVDVVFSLYPRNPEFWLTNYHILLARRLRELFKYLPELNREEVVWRIILQTDCESEPEAMGLFHGFSIHFSDVDTAATDTASTKELQLPYLPVKPLLENISAYSVEQEIHRFILNQGGYGDTSVLAILERNAPRWDSALVVLDWTGSMYGYGAQTLLYHLLDEEKLRVQSFVFFNDGNSKKNDRKKNGKTGGVYHLKGSPNQVRNHALTFFEKVMRKGDGGDREENDIEALVLALKKTQQYKDVILVADNNACIRDFALLEKVNKPIHVILPGEPEFINHQYVNLVYKTKGTLHTLRNDITSFESGNRPEKFVYNNYSYLRNPFDYFQCEAPFAHKFCNAFYGIERYGKQSRDWLENQSYNQSNR